MQSVAFSLVNTLQMIGFGLLTGTLVSVAVAYGRGEFLECGRAWRRSLGYAAALGAVGAAISAGAGELAGLSGAQGLYADSVARVALLLGLSLPAQLVFTTTSFFLEAIGRPYPGMIAMALAGLLNVFLSWLLVFGHGALPALGAEGAALSALAIRILLAAGLIAFALRFRDAQRFGTRTGSRGTWRSGAQQRRIGYADGLSLGIESGSFTIMNLFAATLGISEVSAYAIALSVLGVVFTLALGISAATAILVGRAHGRHSPREMVRAAWIGLAANTIVMALAGLVLAVAPDAVAGLYSTDPLVVAAAAPLVLVVAATMIGDGGQRVLAQSLRACHDAWFPTALHMVSYAAIMVPLGWILAFPQKLGTIGLLTAIAIASFTALTILALRFQRVAAALRTRWRAEMVSATGRAASAARSTPSRTGAAPQDRPSCP